MMAELGRCSVRDSEQATGPEQETVDLEVRTVYNELYEIAAEYFTFGLKLGVQYRKLKAIESNFTEVDRRFQEVIAEWLSNSTDSKWQAIAESLKEMKKDTLAQKIYSKYCSIADYPRRAGNEVCNDLRSPSSRDTSDLDRQYPAPGADVHAPLAKRQKCVEPEPGHKPTAILNFVEEVKENILIGIQKKWLTLLASVLLGLKSQSTDIQLVRLVICNFPASKEHTNILLFQEHLEKLRNVESIDEIFQLLGQYEYWSWKHPHLLDAIVHALGTAQLKNIVKYYMKDLEVFRINLKLSEYAELVPKYDRFNPLQKPDFVSMIFKLGARWSDYTLQCVEAFWASVVKEFSLFPYALIFHEAKPGCVSLTFLIPASLAPCLVLESKKRLSFFMNHNIIMLAIAENIVIDTNLVPTTASQPRGGKTLTVMNPTPTNLAEAEESIATLSMCLRGAQQEVEELKKENQVLQSVLDTPVEKQDTPALDLSSEFQLCQLNDKAFRAIWTLDLNGFFYNYIMSRNEEILESGIFNSTDSNRDYQLIFSPRAHDSWHYQNCSLFLYRSGNRAQLPKRLIFRCRIPGVAGDNIQYFEVQPNREQASCVGDGYIIAKIFFFVSYSFFLQHLNVCPCFQIVADVML